MSHVAIYIEDDVDGLIGMRIDFTNGFNKDSHAHIMATKIRDFLDTHPGLTNKTNEEETMTYPEGTVTSHDPSPLIVRP